MLLYMPMIPEALIAMLACARIGATHVVVFGGFASGVRILRWKQAGGEGGGVLLLIFRAGTRQAHP